MTNDYQPKGNNFHRQKNNNDLVNERIRAKEVRLISPTGENLGVVPIKKAQQMSIEMNLDLYCINPQANPPVCKILDYGKFKFEKEKSEKESKKNQKRTVVKEIRFTATTDKHDLETKAKAAIKFLGEGMKVKASVYIKGRMMSRMDIVKNTLDTFIALVQDYATIEKQAELLGKYYFIVLNPKKKEEKKHA